MLWEKLASKKLILLKKWIHRNLWNYYFTSFKLWLSLPCYRISFSTNSTSFSIVNSLLLPCVFYVFKNNVYY